MGQPKLSKLSLWGLDKQYAEGRAYVDPRTRLTYPSVTTVLKLVDKGGLSQWAADQAVLWCAENWDLLGRRSEEDAFKAARFRWKDVRDERAQVGTGIHETVEAIHTGSWNFPALDDEQQAIMVQWELLNEEHDIKPLLSEFTVFDIERGYAGTADGLWDIDGVRTLVDIKTSRNHWPEHDYQLGALWSAPEWAHEVGDMEWDVRPRERVDAGAIIHLRADKREIIPVRGLDLNASVFEGYLTTWKALDALKHWTAAEAQNEKTAALADGFPSQQAA